MTAAVPWMLEKRTYSVPTNT